MAYPMRGHSLIIALTWIAHVAGAWGVRPATAQQVTGAEVKAAIRAGVRHLRRLQRADGSWPDASGRTGGTTGLAVLAMVNAGVPADDNAVAAGLDYLARLENRWTYVVALKIQALAAADPVKYRRHIQAAAAWLGKAQRSNGG